jgi:CxxC motif-containing protein
LSMAVEKRHFTCVICPIGCEIDVDVKDGEIVSMEGNKCTKSEDFVRQELVEPMRTLTTTVRIKGARWPMLPVRTDKPIPKRLFFDVMKEVADVEVRAPVKVSDVVLRDVASSGADIIASRNMGTVDTAE